MATPLTPQDVARLLAQPSPDLRAELADSMAAHLSGNDLAPGEVALARDIVRLLARDVETKVRAALSHGLRHSPNLPHDVAMKLAADIDSVALPVLAESVVLTDDDLVALVRGGSPRKQSAIAGRPHLTETVSEAIVEHGAEPAVAVLMGNPTAAIAEASFQRAMTRFAGSDRVKSAMAHRDGLPMTVCERLVTMISAQLQEHILKTQALPAGVATDIVLGCREHAMIMLSAGAPETELRQLIAQLHHTGRLTPALVFRALCLGDIAFFEVALAEMGEIPIGNAQILIHEKSGRGLDALYRKARMPPALFGAFQTAVQVVDETAFDGGPRDLERFRARVISRVLTMTENVEPEIADYLVAKLGDVLVHAHEPPYLAAVPN